LFSIRLFLSYENHGLKTYLVIHALPLINPPIWLGSPPSSIHHKVLLSTPYPGYTHEKGSETPLPCIRLLLCHQNHGLNVNVIIHALPLINPPIWLGNPPSSIHHKVLLSTPYPGYTHEKGSETPLPCIRLLLCHQNHGLNVNVIIHALPLINPPIWLGNQPSSIHHKAWYHCQDQSMIVNMKRVQKHLCFPSDSS
jgi:hypothetical protein